MYLEQGIPEKVANDMIVKKGIDILKEKIHNAETKTILKAGTFTTIADATQKVMENEDDDTNKHIFNVRTPYKPYTRNNTYNNNTNYSYNKYKQNNVYHQNRVTNNFNDRNRYNSDNMPQQKFRANPQNTKNQSWRTNNNRRIYQTSVQAQGNHFLDQHKFWLNLNLQNESINTYNANASKCEDKEETTNILHIRKHEMCESRFNFEETSQENRQMLMTTSNKYFNNGIRTNELYNDYYKEYQPESNYDKNDDSTREENLSKTIQQVEASYEYDLYSASTQFIHENISENHDVDKEIKGIKKVYNDELYNEQFERDIKVTHDTESYIDVHYKAIKEQKDAINTNQSANMKKKNESLKKGIYDEKENDKHCPKREARYIKNEVLNTNYSTVCEELRKASIMSKVKEEYKQILQTKLHVLISKMKQRNEEKHDEKLTSSCECNKFSKIKFKPHILDYKFPNFKSLLNKSMHIKYYPP
ncbi:putative uncharacterized protein DDB_G0282133 [Anopheles funestus]|uniref:putative uncharacterized protein DDB_G0282133 n=1 Tax=Anopheles funestus TaxID=62324 RepID=UPI0020C5B57A|nr:putative uncharacterized protein DDB_G0282133 [Anopheles funestus]